MKHILFVAVETNAAAFLAPLLSRWVDRPPAVSWRLVVGPYADAQLARIADRVPRIVAENSVEGLKTALAALRMESWQADALVVSAGGHPLEFSALVQFDGMPRAQFIDTWTNYRRRFEGPDGFSVGERLFVIDQNAVREASEAGLPQDRMVVTGQPSWENIEPLPPAPRERTLFLSAPVVAGYGHSLGYNERDCWQIVKDLRERQPGMIDRLSFAAHPVEPQPDAATLGDARLVKYDRELLDTTGTVLGMFSSPMIDAFLAGRTVVSIQPNAIGQDQCPLSRHGHIDRIGDADALAAALENPRARERDRLAGALRNSTNRVEQAVLDLVQ